MSKERSTSRSNTGGAKKPVAKAAAKPGAKKVGGSAPPAKAAAPEPKAKPPVKSPLKKNELNVFRDRLQEKLETLVGDLRSMEKQAFKAGDQDASANHMADFGSDNYEQDFTLGLIENDETVVKQINEALARMNAGTYGVCQECGQPIPEARLEVLPWTPCCVNCQAKLEKM